MGVDGRHHALFAIACVLGARTAAGAPHSAAWSRDGTEAARGSPRDQQYTGVPIPGPAARVVHRSVKIFRSSMPTPQHDGWRC